MSSRKGNFIKAVEVLDGVEKLLEQEGREVDARLVLAAVKYAFLRYKMGGDIVFDWQESVSMTGNSGVYLLYSAVRARKILAKVAEKVEKVSNKVVQKGVDEGLSNKVVQEGEEKRIVQEKVETVEECERKLYNKVVQFAEVLRTAVREKAPHKLCTYLYELAQEFSRFYEQVPVAGSARECERVELVRAELMVMEQGLGLLGIEIPEEM